MSRTWDYFFFSHAWQVCGLTMDSSYPITLEVSYPAFRSHHVVFCDLGLLLCAFGSVQRPLLLLWELLVTCCHLMNCCLCQQNSGNDNSYQEKNLVMSLREILFPFKRRAMRKSRTERLWSRTFYRGMLISLILEVKSVIELSKSMLWISPVWL